MGEPRRTGGDALNKS